MSIDIDLRSYSAKDWLHCQPAIHALKALRYRRIDVRYRKKPARSRLSADESVASRGANILISIAFEDAELIGWQARLVRRNVPSAKYVVVDNSHTEAGAQAIKRICETEHCDYYRTPENPWVRSPSRSHALALNWAWENVVQPSRPDGFGFLDADLFPLEPTDPFEPLRRQDFYGVVRNVGARWFLWAGFCIFKFEKVERLPLDFGQAWFIGLDTGGANWRVLYRRYDLSALERAETSFFPYRDGIAVSEGPFQRCGPWLHEVGQMGRSTAAARRAALREVISQTLAL
jgi:hypothetical protein